VLPTAAAQTRARRNSTEGGARVPKFMGASLADFKLGTYVGFGAFGFVRIAKHIETGTIVAIKAMSKGYLVSKHQVRHAIGERDLLRDCNHHGVVQFYGSFQDDSMIYICLEFLNGGELFTLLGIKQRLSNDAARALAAEIVLVFDYINAKDIIYRDLKPENVMLDSTGHVRLIDFGLAKRCPDRTWTMCGTPEYLAPEVVTNQGHNRSADFWTLGSARSRRSALSARTLLLPAAWRTCVVWWL
jgi:serine/threonine protein kinase